MKRSWKCATSIRRFSKLGRILGLLAIAVCLCGYSSEQTHRMLALDSRDGLDAINTKMEVAMYRGRNAIRLVALPDHKGPDDVMMAFVSGEDFKDGTIEIDVAGSLVPDAPSDDRGFIGLAFHAQEHGARREVIYIRPTNGRADDQVRRNHSVQYESIPDFPWYRLRQENPGEYESYSDLDAGAWTRLKIVVTATKARLYINGSEQPCLIVNDLKLGETHGQVALWARWSTDAYFSNLTITHD